MESLRDNFKYCIQKYCDFSEYLGIIIITWQPPGCPSPCSSRLPQSPTPARTQWQPHGFRSRQYSPSDRPGSEHSRPEMPGGFHSVPPGTGEYSDLHSEKQSSRFMGLLNSSNTQRQLLRTQTDTVPFREIRFTVAHKVKRSHGIPRVFL